MNSVLTLTFTKGTDSIKPTDNKREKEEREGSRPVGHTNLSRSFQVPILTKRERNFEKLAVRKTRSFVRHRSHWGEGAEGYDLSFSDLIKTVKLLNV